MSQELSDAEWLRYQVATVDDPPNQPPEGSECIYLTNEFVARMRSIADRLERPGVEMELVQILNTTDGTEFWSTQPLDKAQLRDSLGRDPIDNEKVIAALTPKTS